VSRDDSTPIPSANPTAFATTEWSIVLAAGSATAARHAALERLCRTYWQPVYAFIRQLGHEPTHAKDLTQSLFAHLLANDFFATADPARGRFRAYLRQTARLFLGNEWQKNSTLKRGGGVQWVPWDALTPDDEAQFARSSDPSADYDRQWALALLRSAKERLQQEYETAGDAKIFTLLQPFLAARPAPGDYDRLAASLGVARGTVPVLVHRLGKRYQELIRAEVASTVAMRSDIDEELRACLAALQS
jgi:DNA-directed RNA polymerase specialized sigma24 family protein